MLGALIVALLIVTIIAAAFGSVPISPATLGAMTLNRLGLAHFAIHWPVQDEVIFFDLRLPRVIGAALVGLALATAGVLFQGLLRNPLADPYVVGTSGGASLGAVIGTIISSPLHLVGFGLVPLLAFIGALAAMALVYELARVGGRTPVVTLLLAGFAVSTILGYCVSFLLIINDRLQLDLPGIYSWLYGGVAISAWSQLAIVGPVIVITTILSNALSYRLNALSLGEDTAARLGIAVERDKLLVIVAGSLLTASAVSISGLVGFVGLFVPHAMRLLGGPDHRRLLPTAGLAGASFLVIADLFARTILSPTEIPVGILTAALGGPYFLYLLRASRSDYQL